MKCPYCKESEEFLSEDELVNHIVNAHPEKTTSAEAYGKALEKAMQATQLWALAATLTAASFGEKGDDPDAVLERFKYFLKKLYESRGEIVK